MTLFYLDTSALLKRYRTELGSDCIESLFKEKLSKNQIATSFLAVIEMNGAVSRLRKSKAITNQEADDILSYFGADMENRVEIIPITEQILIQAVQISGTYGNRAADSIHAATMVDLSIESGYTGASLVALIADRRLCGTAEDKGISVLNPEENNALARLKGFLV